MTKSQEPVKKSPKLGKNKENEGIISGDGIPYFIIPKPRPIPSTMSEEISGIDFIFDTTKKPNIMLIDNKEIK